MACLCSVMVPPQLDWPCGSNTQTAHKQRQALQMTAYPCLDFVICNSNTLKYFITVGVLGVILSTSCLMGRRTKKKSNTINHNASGKALVVVQASTKDKEAALWALCYCVAPLWDYLPYISATWRFLNPPPIWILLLFTVTFPEEVVFHHFHRILNIVTLWQGMSALGSAHICYVGCLLVCSNIPLLFGPPLATRPNFYFYILFNHLFIFLRYNHPQCILNLLSGPPRQQPESLRCCLLVLFLHSESGIACSSLACHDACFGRKIDQDD